MNGAVRILALALCGIAAGTLALMSLEVAFPALVLVAAIVGALGRSHLNLSRQNEARAAMGVAVLFILRWMLLPAPGLGATRVRFVAVGLLDYEYAYPIAQALLVWMVVLFFVRRGGDLPQTLPLYPALVVILAGTMPSRAFGAWQGAAYQGAALALALASGAYFCVHAPIHADSARPRSRIRRNAYAAISAFVLVFGWGLGQLLHRHGMDLDMMIVNMMPNSAIPASPGFSGEGRLNRINAIKTRNADTVALRIASESAPGYLRGRAFDTFESDASNGTHWECNAKAVPVRPTRDGDVRSRPRWFPLTNEDADLSSGRMTIEPASSFRGVMFTNLETARVQADAEEISVDPYRIALAGPQGPGAPYAVAGEVRADSAPGPAERAALLAVPATLDPRIRALADEISQHCTTDAEKVQAVAAYLQATCTYSLDPPLSEIEDPVVAFLFDTRAGHCELFATSAALLLRCAGVPCRYVTGFVSAEQNAYGGYWVARNRDAHAWVEAYVAGSGWTIVEATPANGVPQGSPSQFAQLWDYAAHQVKSAIAAVRNMSARELIAAAAGLFVRWLPAIACVVGAGVAVWAVVRAIARYRQRCAALGADPIARAMDRRLRAMDRRAARRGSARARSETIDRFADRIANGNNGDIAAWYRAYSRARYGGDTAALETVLGRRGPL